MVPNLLHGAYGHWLDKLLQHAAETVISIPQHLLMHAGVAVDSSDYGPAFKLLIAEMGVVDQRNILCLLLILERARGDASKWSAYINMLPPVYGEGMQSRAL